MTRPFRFGLLIETADTTRQRLLDLAHRAADDGYAIFLGTDHLGLLASVPLLQLAAEATSLRIGTLVLNNDNRQPIVLAQELAALDVVTEGRLEIGLGAGWARPEYDAAGMAFERPARRVARLQATVDIVKQALSEGRVDRDADGETPAIHMEHMPRSVQRPHPPILIGGGGRRVMSYAAQAAQIVGLDPRGLPEGGHDNADITQARIDEKVGWIRTSAGERWPELEINIIIFGVDPLWGTGSGATLPRRPDISDEEIMGSPHYLLGDSAAMVDQLLARRERWGINYVAVHPEHMDVLAPVIARLAGT